MRSAPEPETGAALFPTAVYTPRIPGFGYSVVPRTFRSWLRETVVLCGDRRLFALDVHCAKLQPTASFTGLALAHSRLECRKSRLRNLHVVLRRIEARADATDHLAIDDDR